MHNRQEDSVEDLKIEIAIFLYAQNRLSIGKACELADRSLWEFRQLLASRQEADLQANLAGLRELGLL